MLSAEENRNAQTLGLERLKDFMSMATVTSILPDNPLFFIKFIRKNKPYLNLLGLILKEHFDEVTSFLAFLEHTSWSEEVVAYVAQNHSQFQANNGMDLIYSAYLSGLIKQSFFQDFVTFNNSLQSFSGLSLTYKDKEGAYVLPPLPKAISIKRYRSGKEADNEFLSSYLYDIWERLSQNAYFCFSETRFRQVLAEHETLSVFEIKLDAALFYNLLEPGFYSLWFNLIFASVRYPLIYGNKVGNEVRLYVPGNDLSAAFMASAAQSPDDRIKPVMAYGIISMDTSQALHLMGYHVVSILDSRFNSLVRLHGRLGNSLLVEWHDSFFHALAYSAHPDSMRNKIIRELYCELKHFDESLDLSTLSSQQAHLIRVLLDELRSRCVDIGQVFERTAASYQDINMYYRETLKTMYLEIIYVFETTLANESQDRLLMYRSVHFILERFNIFIQNKVEKATLIDSEAIAQFIEIFKLNNHSEEQKMLKKTTDTTKSDEMEERVARMEKRFDQIKKDVAEMKQEATELEERAEQIKMVASNLMSQAKIRENKMNLLVRQEGKEVAKSPTVTSTSPGLFFPRGAADKRTNPENTINSNIKERKDLMKCN